MVTNCIVQEYGSLMNSGFFIFIVITENFDGCD